jgi:hypothetical protein
MRAVSSFIALAVLTSWLTMAPVQAQSGSSCDRACLGDVMTRYLNSLVAHDPKQAPLADSVRFTEDAAVKPIGDGVWKTATKLRPYRTDFLDVRQGTAAVHAVIEENGAPVLFAARLKVVDRKITEIESMVARNAQEAMLFAPENLKEKSVAMTTMPPKAQLTPRDEMVQIAIKYPEGLRIGSFAKAGVPFAPEVYRFENGVRMGGPGCTFQPPSCVDMLNQRIPTLAGMRRRVIAVDEEAGLVMLWLDFGPGSLMGANGAGKSLVTFEGFKIYGGQIHAVEAIFKGMPLNAPTGWDEPVR